MRIGAVCGVHGTNEQFSVDVYESLCENPIPGIEPILANELAVATGDDVRFVDENMARSFKYPDQNSRIYERRRAAEVIAWAKHGQFDLLVDIHSNRHDEDLYAAISMHASSGAIKVAKFFGHRNILIEDVNIHQHFPDSVLLEFFGSGRTQKRIADLRCDLGDLAAYDDLEHFDVDYTNHDQVNYWMYGGMIPVGDKDPHDAMQMGYAEEPFSVISYDDMKELGIRPRPPGRYIRPHALIFSSAYADLGLLGEYAYHASTTNGMHWRLNAESLHEDLCDRQELAEADA